jgi:hypothetical protein
MYYSSSPSDKLDINFDVESYTRSSVHWIPGTEVIVEDDISWHEYKKDFTNIDVFDNYDGLDSVFEGIEDELSIMD